MLAYLIIFFTLLISSHSVFARKANHFIYGVPDKIITLNPFNGTGTQFWTVQLLVYDFLLKEKLDQQKDHSMELMPALATQWSVSSDKKVYEFELRPHLVWSDGTALTTEDIKFSLEHMFDEKFKSLWRGSYEGISKIEVLSPTRIRITAKNVSFELWYSIAKSLRILPKHFYKNPNSKSYNKNLLGSGPYVLSSFESGKKIELKKNSLWWGWKDSFYSKWFKFDEIQLKSISDPNTLPYYFKKNEIDSFPVNDDSIHKKFEKNTELSFIDNPNLKTSMIELIEFNLQDALLSDFSVRKALNMIVNKNEVCAKIYKGSQPATSLWDESNKENNVYSIKEAQKLLTEAGWKDTDKDGILDKNKLPFKLEVIFESSNSELMLTTLIEHFKKNGILLSLKKVDHSTSWKILHEKKYQSMITQLPNHLKILKSVWHSTGFYNNSGLSDKKIDKEIEELDQEFDFKKRYSKEQSIKQKISELYPVLVLCRTDFPDFMIGNKHKVKLDRKGLPFWGWFQ